MGSDLDKIAKLSLDDPPSKPSFFSRLASPLRSRTRNLADFHIRLKEPHRKYSAGDHVKGHVVLSVTKPIRITHLTVALHGYVRAYKSAGAAAQLGPVNPAIASSSDGGRGVRYHGNGHASLFQDEQVLCGDGRLKPMRYEFEFELIFPSKGLPSSIDFERGTVSYMVTATLTRPTSIAPTISCEAKVSLVERLDIGLLIPPREQKVTMQTMRRRAKRKKAPTKTAPLVKVSSAPAEPSEPTPGRDPTTRVNESVQLGHTNPDEPTTADHSTVILSRSPIPSDIQSEFSGDSAVSNNSGSNSGRGAEGSGESLAGSGSRKSGADDREITATVELLKGGCLPGDILPVKIRIEHNRRMKSMHGIIVTLYRQGRVDYAPPAHLFTNMSKEEAAKLEREDYYPRSRTGLGGLSLSSAGSCSVFRKDLSQTVAPLIIDPATLTANITTSVRVPEDVFPSIKGVPGGMISFRYHVEVIVDLGGKLGGQSSGTPQHLHRIGSMTLHGSSSGSPVSPYEGKNIASWNPAIVDTDHLRREKGVISVTFEAIVGTTDSNRSRGKQVARPVPTMQPTSSQDVLEEQEELGYAWQGDYNGEGEWSGHLGTAQQYHQSSQGYYPPVVSPQTSYYDFQGHEPHAPVYVPPEPEIQDPTNLSEKERVRQAEQRLLPSQPTQQPPEPAEAGPSSSQPQPQPPPQPQQPCAPSQDLQQQQQTSRLGTQTPPSHGSSALAAPVVSVAPLLGNGDDDDNAGEGPSAPTLADLSQVGPSRPTDDKQELERRRLLEEASAPPEVPEDYNNNHDDGDATAGPSAPPPLQPQLNAVAGLSAPVINIHDEPSAPVFNDDDEDHYHGTATAYGPRDPLHSIAGPSSSSAPTAGPHHYVHGHEPLPRYER